MPRRKAKSNPEKKEKKKPALYKVKSDNRLRKLTYGLAYLLAKKLNYVIVFERNNSKSNGTGKRMIQYLIKLIKTNDGSGRILFDRGEVKIPDDLKNKETQYKTRYLERYTRDQLRQLLLISEDLIKKWHINKEETGKPSNKTYCFSRIFSQSEKDMEKKLKKRGKLTCESLKNKFSVEKGNEVSIDQESFNDVKMIEEEKDTQQEQPNQKSKEVVKSQPMSTESNEPIKEKERNKDQQPSEQSETVKQKNNCCDKDISKEDNNTEDDDNLGDNDNVEDYNNAKSCESEPNNIIKESLNFMDNFENSSYSDEWYCESFFH
ncbi:hypothetical protein QTN25_006919 [Entamoeba marina]